MNAQDRFLRGSGGQAEDLARFRVEPRSLEMHALFTFNRKICGMGFSQLFLRDSDEPVVHVHESRHHGTPFFFFFVFAPWAGIRRAINPCTATVIG
ncbi:MAG: hypothetical protein ABIW36_03385 [Terrimesophilobacter sp.]